MELFITIVTTTFIEVIGQATPGQNGSRTFTLQTLPLPEGPATTEVRLAKTSATCSSPNPLSQLTSRGS